MVCFVCNPPRRVGCQDSSAEQKCMSSRNFGAEELKGVDKGWRWMELLSILQEVLPELSVDTYLPVQLGLCR